MVVDAVGPLLLQDYCRLVVELPLSLDQQHEVLKLGHSLGKRTGLWRLAAFRDSVFYLQFFSDLFHYLALLPQPVQAKQTRRRLELFLPF